MQGEHLAQTDGCARGRGRFSSQMRALESRSPMPRATANIGTAHHQNTPNTNLKRDGGHHHLKLVCSNLVRILRGIGVRGWRCAIIVLSDKKILFP